MSWYWIFIMDLKMKEITFLFKHGVCRQSETYHSSSSLILKPLHS